MQPLSVGDVIMWKHQPAHVYVLVDGEDKLVPVNLETLEIFQRFNGLERSLESGVIVVLGNLKTGLKSAAVFLKEHYASKSV